MGYMLGFYTQQWFGSDLLMDQTLLLTDQTLLLADQIWFLPTNWSLVLPMDRSLVTKDTEESFIGTSVINTPFYIINTSHL